MASPRIIPLVLAGGAGTRLWPVSRDAMPKQFLPLVGEKSTYQQALMRVSGDLFAPPIVMTSDACRAGRDAAAQGAIVTFGIRPTAPKTSYGYIRCGEALDIAGVSRVAAFVEKPDAETAAG